MPRQKLNEPSKLFLSGNRGGAYRMRPQPCPHPCPTPCAPAAAATSTASDDARSRRCIRLMLLVVLLYRVGRLLGSLGQRLVVLLDELAVFLQHVVGSRDEDFAALHL